MYICIYLYKLCMSMFNVNIYIKNKTFVVQRVIFRFLPSKTLYSCRSLRRLLKFVLPKDQQRYFW